MSKGKVITLVIIGCVLLAVANVALWASLDLFNADRFGANVAAGLQSPEATEALAVGGTAAVAYKIGKNNAQKVEQYRFRGRTGD